MLKKIALVVALLLVATNLWALRPLDVSKTVHNLGSTTPVTGYGSEIEDEVCIFCHTPHGGTLNGPLWNRSVPGAAGFTHYTSSTLSGYMAGLSVSRNVEPESLLCLSCHDGTVAMGSMININNRTGAATDVPVMFGEIFPGWGGSMVIGNLADDHPISFSYTQAFTSAGGKLKEIATPANAGVRFFGATNRVECSSCHDPHVDYRSATGDATFTPFLVMGNSGSALCLACHNK